MNLLSEIWQFSCSPFGWPCCNTNFSIYTSLSKTRFM